MGCYMGRATLRQHCDTESLPVSHCRFFKMDLDAAKRDYNLVYAVFMNKCAGEIFHPAMLPDRDCHCTVGVVFYLMLHVVNKAEAASFFGFQLKLLYFITNRSGKLLAPRGHASLYQF